MMKLSDYVMRFVAGQGVRHVFLVTGGGAMHDCLAMRESIELPSRHQSSLPPVVERR